MERLEFSYNSCRISYLRFGSGPKRAICFHGYGEEAACFSFLESCAGGVYTFFAIDLPFHGQTVWRDEISFTTADLLQIIEQVQFQYDGHRKLSNLSLSLVGYSLGGRVGLSLYEMIPMQVEKMVLLAPDGLKINFWYWFATQTWMGNKLFFYTMKHPNWFLFLLTILNKLKWVNASIYKFVGFYAGNEAAREILYRRWTSLKEIKPPISKIKSLVVKNKTPFRLLYGKHDRIILPIRGEKFMKGIEKYCELTVIESGHQVLHQKHAEEILRALLH